MNILTFDEAAHVYRVDGVRVPSVTQIISMIKPDFSAIPSHILNAKRDLGTAVHFACELDSKGELDEESTSPKVMAYVKAWRKFQRDTSCIIDANEQQLYHKNLRFAGTLDLRCRIRTEHEANTGPWILDFKTCVDPHPSFGVQLAGYETLVKDNCDDYISKPVRRGTLHLEPDGRYRLHEYRNPADAATFMACLTIHQWHAKHSN